MAAPRPTVVLLSPYCGPWYYGLKTRLLSAIESRATLIDVKDKATLVGALAASPQAVLFAGPAIFELRHSDLGKILANYARNGGTVRHGLPDEWVLKTCAVQWVDEAYLEDAMEDRR